MNTISDSGYKRLIVCLFLVWTIIFLNLRLFCIHLFVMANKEQMIVPCSNKAAVKWVVFLAFTLVGLWVSLYFFTERGFMKRRWRVDLHLALDINRALEIWAATIYKDYCLLVLKSANWKSLSDKPTHNWSYNNDLY